MFGVVVTQSKHPQVVLQPLPCTVGAVWQDVVSGKPSKRCRLNRRECSSCLCHHLCLRTEVSKSERTTLLTISNQGNGVFRDQQVGHMGKSENGVNVTEKKIVVF